MELTDTSEEARKLAKGGDGSRMAAAAEEEEEAKDEKNNDENDGKMEGVEKDDDSVTSTDSDSSDVGVDPTKADEMLIKATAHKEEGNSQFKKGDMDKAARSYRRGCNSLKGLNKNNTGDEQVKGLLAALQTNLSMVCYKQNKFKMSASVASKALEVDKANVKALYRRALAYRKMGDLEKARCDLREAIKVDANNNACKKELVSVKKELEQSKQNQKKALSKAFSSKAGSSFLYNDKEEEEKRKAEEKQRKKEEEQEMAKKRKADWEDECVHRMAKNEPAISFEEWDKQRKEEEEEKKKAEEKLKKEQNKRREEERRKAREAKRAANKGSDSDDDELTESELAMMRGYKKTADGRTTSYFTKELSESEKAAIGCIKPKRLDEASDSTGSISRTVSASPTGSAWNQAGTWEEKDTTAWCISQLRKRLEATTVTSKLDADIVSIEDVTGHASVAIAGTKKRYIFDLHVKLKYEIKDPEQDKVVASGVIKLPDIDSSSHEELEVVFDSWTKSPGTNFKEQALDVRSSLAKGLREGVQLFVSDFNDRF